MARNDARKARFQSKMRSLESLRKGLWFSQDKIASVMEVQQPAISKLVCCPDMKLSTLRDLIAAMGGKRHITAAFADHSVEIGNSMAATA